MAMDKLKKTRSEISSENEEHFDEKQKIEEKGENITDDAELTSDVLDDMSGDGADRGDQDLVEAEERFRDEIQDTEREQGQEIQETGEEKLDEMEESREFLETSKDTADQDMGRLSDLRSELNDESGNLERIVQEAYDAAKESHGELGDMENELKTNMDEFNDELRDQNKRIEQALRKKPDF